MHYVHYINNDKYYIKIISYNHYEVYKNGFSVEVCDTYEEAQDYIDNAIQVNNKTINQELSTLATPF